MVVTVPGFELLYVSEEEKDDYLSKTMDNECNGRRKTKLIYFYLFII